MAHPPFTEFERRTRHTFQVMMWGLSYPGRTFDLLASGQGAFVDIAQSLLDLETSFYCQDEKLTPMLEQTGARHLSADRASYHFYPELRAEQLQSFKQASLGTLLYPDESATLFIGCKFGQGAALTLSGPGIPPDTTQTIQIGDVPVELWGMRERAIRYPLGWDICLIAGNQLIGLPRTTNITIEESS